MEGKMEQKQGLQAGLRVRSDVRAGGYGACMTYCDQERVRCAADPSMPAGACADRHPVCQNACTVCAVTP
jgi:hypothetical protein